MLFELTRPLFTCLFLIAWCFYFYVYSLLWLMWRHEIYQQYRSIEWKPTMWRQYYFCPYNDEGENIRAFLCVLCNAFKCTKHTILWCLRPFSLFHEQTNDTWCQSLIIDLIAFIIFFIIYYHYYYYHNIKWFWSIFNIFYMLNSRVLNRSSRNIIPVVEYLQPRDFFSHHKYHNFNAWGICLQA